MKENLRIAKAVQEKISHCSGSCHACTCTKLAKYMEEIGIEEFVRRLEANELPEDINTIYQKKAKQVS